MLDLQAGQASRGSRTAVATRRNRRPHQLLMIGMGLRTRHLESMAVTDRSIAPEEKVPWSSCATLCARPEAKCQICISVIVVKITVRMMTS
jgi:hypothetical protein